MSSALTPIIKCDRAIQALIRDWQFLESLGMGPIQLVGEDEDEERERTGRDGPPMEEGNA